MLSKIRSYHRFFYGIAALSSWVMTLAGCGNDRIEENTITVREFVRVNPKHFNDHLAVDKLTVSGNGNHVYLTVNKNSEVYHGSGEDLENDWTKIKTATDFDGSVGKAKLTRAAVPLDIPLISATNDGAIISIQSDKNPGAAHNLLSNDHGIIHLQGKKTIAAWSPNAQDIDAGAFAWPPAPGAPDKLGEALPIFGFVISHDGKDVPYFVGVNVALRAASGSWQLSMVTKGDLSPTLVSNAVKRDTTPFDASSFPRLIKGGDYLFAVDSNGVTTLPKADIGKTKNFENVINATVASGNGVVGSDAFQMKAGTINKTVSAIEISGNYLFIGLRSAADFTGGVAVYEIKPSGQTPGIKAPALSWRERSVIDLFKDKDDRVWAVTADNVFEAKVNGERGDSYFDTLLPVANTKFAEAQSGYDKTTFPKEHLKSIRLVNGKPVIATAKGLWVLREVKKPILGSKLAGTN
jgi:hypothetical protein